ncbi:MAG TPA: polyketide cyclase [Actinophytocola sp.]|uniref:polyketide cyclase n=1 Tax=Actinophytocola sp. TaxID=1872138 RepID=UPI002DDD0552|nr:polyketide cyclase [Actinophytocola sp.]HEV2780582.1 polyketide cyclase [Actinophytocola sp.]
MSLHEYRFRHVWSVETAAAKVFGALVDLGSYPRWWPDVRSVSRVDDNTAELTCRALLPYALVFRMHRAEQDERNGLLRVHMTGDLEGYVQGVVAAHRPSQARLEISQEVVVRKKLLRRLAPVARPLFRANHAAMMRRGHRGLRAYLASGTS